MTIRPRCSSVGVWEIASGSPGKTFPQEQAHAGHLLEPVPVHTCTEQVLRGTSAVRPSQNPSAGLRLARESLCAEPRLRPMPISPEPGWLRLVLRLLSAR